MAHNTNRVRNGGFEQSSPGTDPGPFWTATGPTGAILVETGGTQLLGNQNIFLSPNTIISQQLLPLQVGEIYEFSIGLSSFTTGLNIVEIGIEGTTTVRSFASNNLVPFPDYGQYSFTFEATVANPTLTITNTAESNLRIDVVSIYLKNSNHVRNGGFEQSIPSGDPGPFWTGTGVIDIEAGAFDQLLGNQNARFGGIGSISQQLLPLQVGEIYEFSAGFSTVGATSGTVNIAIDGTTVRSFQAANLVDFHDYSQYSFTFEATVANPTLTITNNSNGILRVDIVSVYLK